MYIDMESLSVFALKVNLGCMARRAPKTQMPAMAAFDFWH